MKEEGSWSLTFILRRGDLKAEVGLGSVPWSVRGTSIQLKLTPDFLFFFFSSHHPLSPLYSVYLSWRNIVCGVSSFITTHIS